MVSGEREASAGVAVMDWPPTNENRARPSAPVGRDRLPVCDGASQIAIAIWPVPMAARLSQERRNPRGASRGFRSRATWTSNGVSARLWGAVGGDQPGLPDHHLAAGSAQAGSFKIRPGPFRAIAADLLDVETVALDQRYRHAGFDLRSKSGKYGERGGNERGKSHCGKSLDHDGPLPWAVSARRFVAASVTKPRFRTSSRMGKMVSSHPCFVSSQAPRRNIAGSPSRRAEAKSGSLAQGTRGE